MAAVPQSPLLFLLLLLLSLRWSSFSPSATVVDRRQFRTHGEHCDGVAILCERALQCLLVAGKRTCREASAAAGGAIVENNRCLHAKCPVLFPDCPHDTVPVLIQTAEELSAGEGTDDECCPPSPSMVRCQCDPKKCLIPACPDGTERVLVQLGTERPGECCDRFECRQPECDNVRCPDSLDTLDLYSPDGLSCPPDSYHPAPYIPPGACCPIISQCTCRLGICEPARQCPSGELLVVRRRAGGEPGRCCDEFECRPANESQKSADGCQHGGRTFAVGERWHSAPCQECQCGSDGISKCRRMECPKLAQDCTWVGVVPGECCPVCLGCRDEQGLTYDEGKHSDRDGCTNCTCLDFRWQCHKFICKTDCENPMNVPGECCPVCDEPTVVKSPASFRGCPSLRQCPLRCEFGLEQNRVSGCFECKCAEVKKLLRLGGGGGGNGAGGEEDGADGGGLAGDGQITKCESLTEQNCARLCAHGYLRDQNDCPICRCAHCPPMDDRCAKHCVYGFESNSVGCPICKCRAATADTDVPKSTFTPPYLTVVSSYSPLQYSSTLPPSLHCVSGEAEERDIGEWWTDSECWQCFCQQGKEFCSLISCPKRPDECPDEHWTRSTESPCCPSCASSIVQNASFSPPPSPSPQQRHFAQVCHSPGTGQLFVDGETWHLNGCVACTCRMGHVLCSWNGGKQCPPAPCERPLLLESAVDQCCPRCPPPEEDSPPATSELLADTKLPANNCVDDQSGRVYAPGAEWRRDMCQSCRCSSDGRVRCFREHCSASPEGFGGCVSDRMLSLKGRCCSLCSDALKAKPDAALCTYGNSIFARGEQFRDGPCRNCSCLAGGIIRCTEIHCSPCRSDEKTGGNNGTAVMKPDGECCSSCRADPPEHSPTVILYSSFERGIEDQIMFVGDNGENERRRPNGVPDSWAQRHLWLMVAIPALLLTALFALFTAFVLTEGKCRRLKETALKKVAGGNSNKAGCFTNSRRYVVVQRQRKSSFCEGAATTASGDGDVGISLLDTAAAAAPPTTTTISAI
uniref:Cysteine-rich motor neuron 1 protein n=1 Tax=Globodera rostochiensis TaxID=31243 RepID=A0A914HK45_GLORO